MKAPAAIVFFLSMVTPTWAQTNLILNGSFESPLLGLASELPTTPTDWSSSGGINYVISNGYDDNWLAATDGTQVDYLLSSAIPETLSQSGISLTSGQTYQFNLDLSKYAPQSSGGLTVTFSDGTSSVSQSFSITSSEWTHESWDFVATDTGDYTLTVAATVGTYPTIDDLTLTNYSAVPEPAETGLFIGLAAIGVALKRVRRTRST